MMSVHVISRMKSIGIAVAIAFHEFDQSERLANRTTIWRRATITQSRNRFEQCRPIRVYFRRISSRSRASLCL